MDYDYIQYRSNRIENKFDNKINFENVESEKIYAIIRRMDVFKKLDSVNNLNQNAINELVKKAVKSNIKITLHGNSILGSLVKNAIMLHPEEFNYNLNPDITFINKCANRFLTQNPPKKRQATSQIQNPHMLSRFNLAEQKLEEMSKELNFIATKEPLNRSVNTGVGNRVERLKTINRVKTISVGGGFAGSELYLHNKKYMHNQAKKIVANGKLPDYLMIASHFGNWKHDYTLAQTYSLLERPYAPCSPEDFASPEEREQNLQVNAKYLYQANITSLGETEAPLLQSHILAIETRENHQVDWLDSSASYRVKIQCKSNEKSKSNEREIKVKIESTYQDMSVNFDKTIENAMKDNPKPNEIPIDQTYVIIKPKIDEFGNFILEDGKMVFIQEELVNTEIYCEELEVCSGFGEARELTVDSSKTPFGKMISNGIISPEDYKILSHYDPQKGFTPLCDGNTFMLSSREEGVIGGRVCLYGGGGNATATFRKAFHGFDVDAEKLVYDKNNQLPDDIQWFAKEGFELAGYGKLAKNACDYAKTQDQLHCGELVRMQRNPENGAIKCYFKDTSGTYEKQKISASDKTSLRHPLIQIKVYKKNSHGNVEVDSEGNPLFETVSVREYEFDRVIPSIGQEGKHLQNLFREISTDLVVHSDSNLTSIPFGLRSENGQIRFWGAAATVVSPLHKRGLTKNELEKLTKNADKALLNAEEEIFKIRNKMGVLYSPELSIQHEEALKKYKTALENSRSTKIATTIVSNALTELKNLEQIAESRRKEALTLRLEILRAQNNNLQIDLPNLKERYELAISKADIAKITFDHYAQTIKDNAAGINAALRDWLVKERIARDAEWPGVMPPSSTQIRESILFERRKFENRCIELESKITELEVGVDQKNNSAEALEVKIANAKLENPNLDVSYIEEKIKILKAAAEKDKTEISKLVFEIAQLKEAAKQQASLDSINVNMDDLRVIELFLKNCGVEKHKIAKIIDRLLIIRHEAYLSEQFKGIDKSAIEQLIKDLDMGSQVKLYGHSSLVKV